MIAAYRHAPEVVIKVESRGSATLEAIRVHVETMSTGAHRTLEDDQGEQIVGKPGALRLIEDWDLDLEMLLGRRLYFDRTRPKPLKLVHKLIFSMPAGTPPDRLFVSVRDFVQDEFSCHRYALGLHTDEMHPHVHVIVKAVSEQGVRLNIRKATLRGWREAFAGHLRTQGVQANATRRTVRGRRPLIRGASISRVGPSQSRIKERV